jgi:hypothetical protein
VIRQLTFFVSVMSVFLVSAASCFSQPTHVHVVPESVKSGSFEVRKGSGEVSVESRELQIRIELPSHRTETLDVSMLYDPGTKLFWWHVGSVEAAAVRRNPDTPVLLLPNSVICLTDSKFVLFWNGQGSGSYIFVFELAEHYSSLDEGQTRLLHMFEDRRNDIDSDKFIEEYKRIFIKDMDKYFPRDTHSAINIGPMLRDVRRVGDDWQIIEDGHYGGTALIVLNDKYEVVKTTLMPSKDVPLK